MSIGKPPPASGGSPEEVGSTLDEGRRYWKAAIAHLAPEKREAAWDFYLDRLESSAAADTLGGVMLLLEAHLAFFDDLPARLGEAARQLEAAVRPSGHVSVSPSPPLLTSATNLGGSPARRRTKGSSLLSVGVAVVVGVTTGCVGTIFYQHFRSAAVPTYHPHSAQDTSFPQGQSLRVEAWNDPATRLRKGSIVSFSHVATTERTKDGGVRVYLPTPVEEVRENVRALQQLAR